MALTENDQQAAQDLARTIRSERLDISEELLVQKVANSTGLSVEDVRDDVLSAIAPADDDAPKKKKKAS